MADRICMSRTMAPGMFPTSVSASLACLILLAAGCQQSPPTVVPRPGPDSVPKSAAAAPEQNVPALPPDSTGHANPLAGKLRVLFDGKTLEGWKVSQFGGDGDVAVVDGEIDIESGNPLTGISWTGETLPENNYRISLEAKRTAGIDFFCCLTFPVLQSHCSLVVGGWSGTVVGLSSIDGNDASSNETTRLIAFDDDRWYKIEVEVGGDSIRAWIDDEQVLEHPVAGYEFEVRNEVRLSRPLGICTFETDARIREFKILLTGDGKPDSDD